MSYGTDIGREIKDKYGYFIRGRQLMIIEKKLDAEVTLTNEPLYSAPTSSITNGLLLEYTAIPDTSEILNESHEVPLNDTLALALVDYIRASLLDTPDMAAQREYYMKRFRDRVAKYVRVRVGGLRQVVQRNF